MDLFKEDFRAETHGQFMEGYHRYTVNLVVYIMLGINVRRNMENNWQKELTRAARLARRQVKRCAEQLLRSEQELREALAWEDKHHEALLLQSNLYQYRPGTEKITVQDWLKEGAERDIELEKRTPIEEQLKKRFKNAKKLQRAVPHLEKRVAESVARLDNAEKYAAMLESVEDEEAWNVIKSSIAPQKNPFSKNSAPPTRLPYRTFVSESGIEIWVGRTAADNEVLTLKLARGNDWWAHAAGVPGSHIVVRSDTPDEKTLQEALQLALHYSKLSKGGEGEVILTQRKYVSKGPGGHKPGTVSVSKHKTYYIRLDRNRTFRPVS